MQHADLQLVLTQTEKNYFETKLKLDRVAGEKQALQQENRLLEGDRDNLRNKLRQVSEENLQVKDRWGHFTESRCPTTRHKCKYINESEKAAHRIYPISTLHFNIEVDEDFAASRGQKRNCSYWVFKNFTEETTMFLVMNCSKGSSFFYLLHL